MASGNLGPDARPSISYPTMHTPEKEGLTLLMNGLHQRSRMDCTKVRKTIAVGKKNQEDAKCTRCILISL